MTERADKDEILDPKAVCKLLGINRRTLAKLADEEDFPVHRLSSRIHRFRRSEVLKWFDERRQSGAHS